MKTVKNIFEAKHRYIGDDPSVSKKYPVLLLYNLDNDTARITRLRIRGLDMVVKISDLVEITDKEMMIIKLNDGIIPDSIIYNN